MDLIKKIFSFVISLIESIIATFLCNIIFAFFTGIHINLNNLIIFFNRNLYSFLFLLLIFLIFFCQRKRITQSREELYESNPNAVRYAISIFPYKNLLWEIYIERSDFMFRDPPYFNYYIGRQLCPNPKDNMQCLTPLIISDNLVFYTEYCAMCEKKFLRFDNYDDDKYEIQTIIDSLILKYKVQSAEELSKVIENYIIEKYSVPVEK